ncbi:AmiS/UreI family transporter [Microbacterium sp. LRZ72]|uniref:AmiS/UreI family transporter n=1 Tax=Microbacterium sp. LRZ72 TaxID=2942481 RepID=UPI0029B83BB6|nr:AmiS/UreI family transporter [Microbacterium sp. LRZ72]MDX2376673.1 AmiS/UreI family transporter [Microbacterium sp. LRZ72]
MANVGLLYVGAVLFINGLMLIGVIPGRSAAILNFFVGGMQVVFPTLILLQGAGDPAVVFGAFGLYLFGFTYLYVGIIQWTGVSGEGLGWFSLFVVIVATVVGILQFIGVGDPVFGAIWLIWAVLWFMFFLLLGLGKSGIEKATGWFTIFVSFLTGTIPALFLLSGTFQTNVLLGGVVAALGALALIVAVILGRSGRGAEPAPVRVDDATA